MAKYNGTLILTKLDGNFLAHVDNATWDSSFDLAQATDKDSDGFMEYLEEAGLRQASITINGNADFGTAGNGKILADLLKARKNIAFVFGQSGTKGLHFTGNCLINAHSLDTPNEQTSTFTAAATVNGEWNVIIGS